MVRDADRQFYRDNGFVLVKHLFSRDEAAVLREHYMTLRERDPRSHASTGEVAEGTDPLKRFPRMLQMHRWDERSLRWLLDARLNEQMTAFLGREPYAVQTMLYFKPPGARGQALHQDQFYLRVQPGTCIAAWMALDPCDEANGCMQVVPGSHAWPVLCATKADTAQSFTDVTVELPPGAEAVPIIMEAGDVLFFNGSVVHGSLPNRTSDRFRRALIGHYIDGNARAVGQFYYPVLRMDGSEVELQTSPHATHCGKWVDIDGTPLIEQQAIEALPAVRE
jgi:phytanoyl-CoA hydroxylase